MLEPVPALLRWRVINRITGAELTNDLSHLHASTFGVQAMQPGNPGSSALGSFAIPLHPPGSEGYAAAKAIYDQLDYYLRVEAYRSHTGLSIGGAPVFAGFITSIQRTYGADNNTFVISGVSDLALAHYSRPFPGEYLYLKYGSGSSTAADYRQARHYLGTNEPGWTDNYNPYTAGNYLSTREPSGATGTWASTTDDGLTVVTNNTGDGSCLLAQTGAAAGDSQHRQYVEVYGRLLPTASTVNAGGMGVGISKAKTDINNSINANVFAYKNNSTGRWDLSVQIRQVSGGVLTTVATASTALTGTDDPEGFIPLCIGLSLTGADQITAQVTVNGSVVFTTPGISTTVDPGTGTCYPFLRFGAPSSGTATAYFTNLTQIVRFVDDGNANSAAFKPGTVGSPVHSLTLNSAPGPTFLECWTTTATREGFYWRYTPQTYVSGTRTLGSVDFTTDPGTDHSQGSGNSTVLYDRNLGNLISLELTGNADQFVTGTASAGPPSSDGGGLATWRDIGSITKYGVIDDQTLSVIAPNYNLLRMYARQIVSNKIALGVAGAKRGLVLRDPQTADVARELDKVTLNDPILGIYNLTARVVAYLFTEGSATQDMWFDQFSDLDPQLLTSRFQQGVFGMAGSFQHR